MKPAALPLFLVALCAPAGAAFAQGAPPAAGAAVEADALEPPPLPEVPPALRASVDALYETVSNTNECFTNEGERVSHTADPNCPRWYARLARSGLAGVYAIGEAFRPVYPEGAEAPREDIRVSDGAEEQGPRLVQIMARTGRPEAVPFLLSYLVRTATMEESYASPTDTAALAALRTLTGADPAPTAPWEDDTTHMNARPARRALVQRWMRWYNTHQGMTVAQWRAEGAEQARRNLFSDDILERYGAIVRLAPSPTDRVAVTTALQALLTREDLPAAARVHLHRFARRQRIVLPAAPTATVTAAR